MWKRKPSRYHGGAAENAFVDLAHKGIYVSAVGVHAYLAVDFLSLGLRATLEESDELQQLVPLFL